MFTLWANVTLTNQLWEETDEPQGLELCISLSWDIPCQTNLLFSFLLKQCYKNAFSHVALGKFQGNRVMLRLYTLKHMPNMGKMFSGNGPLSNESLSLLAPTRTICTTTSIQQQQIFPHLLSFYKPVFRLKQNICKERPDRTWL